MNWAEELGSVGWLLERAETRGARWRRSEGTSSEWHPDADGVSYTNGYASMAMLVTDSDDAMTMSMSYKVSVLLFVSRACRSAPECQRSTPFLQSPSPTFAARSRSRGYSLRSLHFPGCSGKFGSIAYPHQK